MKAVVVKIFIDLESACTFSYELLKTERIALDKFFVVEEGSQIGLHEAAMVASEFCGKAMQNGIKYWDEKTCDTRYIPARNVITAFESTCRAVSPKLVKVHDKLKIKALPRYV